MDSEQALAIVLFLTAICSYINYKFVKLPKSIGITLVSLLISSFINILSIPFTTLNDYAHNLEISLGFSKTFLHGMLSFLLFAAAIQINPRELSKQKSIIASFATLSVLISTILIGYATYGIAILFELDLPIYYCFVFGALISPTDAITVSAVLRTLSLSKTLEMKISGEALFNDGMAIVLFFLALALAHGDQNSISAGQALLYFLREGGGGIIFGLLLGWLATRFLKDIDDHDLMIILTLVLVTGGYLIANSLNVSGPISMVLAGLIVGSHLKRRAPSHAALQHLDDFWILIDQLLNAVLFVLIGISFVWIDITIPIALSSLAVIVITIAARWISIYLPEAILSRNLKVNTDIITILTWSGLRGGISIALALGLSAPYGNKIVAITYFIVLFSIIVQGLTLKPLITKVYPISALQ